MKRLAESCLTALLLACCVAGGAQDADALRLKQQAQAQARAAAEQLVSAVLDLQLRQLEENGLKSLPAYRDIASMKANIGGLAEGEMQQIVSLLGEAQRGPPAQREAMISAARSLVREVVVRLMAERQKLDRRLQVARLSNDVRQLMDLQNKAHAATRSIAERRADERDQLALHILDDQTDVTKLYYQLVASLTDVSTWTGGPAAAAADGLRILRATQVESELKRAGQSLAAADFHDASAGQANVLKGLAALLERLEETHGYLNTDRDAALRLVRELIARQTDLRQRTSQTEFSEPALEPLIEQQAALQKELGKLALAISKLDVAESLIEQAKAGSFEATASLFDEKKQAAVEQQGRVVTMLSQLEKALEQAGNGRHSEQSAAELAAQVARLETLQSLLDEARRQQQRAITAVADKPQLAQQQERLVAATLDGALKAGEFASALNSRLQEAKDKVAAAEGAMEDRQLTSAPSRNAAADDALAAIRSAAAEVESQLADTRRWQKAVELGELARAAEALERAAAAEAEVAREASDVTGKAGVSKERVAALVSEQTNVAAVAERIATGIEKMAPSAYRILNDARKDIDSAALSLNAAADGGEPSRSAASRTSSAAAQAAKQLTSAAAELRREQGRAAKELQQLAASQLAPTDAARSAVEGTNKSASDRLGQDLQKLQDASRKAAEATREQLRAAGRSEEADAKQLTQQLTDLKNSQQAADNAAQQLAQGKSNPLTASSSQQEVADQVSRLAEQAPGDVADALKDARQSAAAAARETLLGTPAKAKQARQQTAASIQRALQAAEKLAQRAAQLPHGEPDAAAQDQVSSKLTTAQRSLKDMSAASADTTRAADQALGRAAENAASAKQSLASGQSAEARSSQQRALQSLAEASARLNDAIDDLAHKQSEELSGLGSRLGELTDSVSRVDPGALAALSLAQQSATSLAQQSAARAAANAVDLPHDAALQADIRHKIDQASASLAGRSQQLRHDRDLGQALAQLAIEQQAARDEIDDAARQLQQPATDDNGSAQLAAAQSLQQAQQQFAAAQLATGEGAAEVSGQQEVMNRPIREGLEIASRLTRPELPAELSEGGQETGNGEQGTADKGDKPADAESANNPKSKAQNPKSAAVPTQLGTKMVPNSPQMTAKQIAGQKANNAAANAMAAAVKGKGEPGKNEGESETPMEGAASSTAKKGGAAKGGKSAANQKANKGELETADAAQADSRGEKGNQDSVAGGKLEAEAWFAKLPPSLQSAIQAKSRGKAPRGYEERLRRYFESID